MPPSIPLTLMNVPSDVGSMICGKHKAPQAFRQASLGRKLGELGYAVAEAEALPDGSRTWKLSVIEPTGVRRETENVEVCYLVHRMLNRSLACSHEASEPPFQLVIGGECCMLPAIMSSFWQTLKPARIGLIYVDGDADLTVPGEAGSSGNFASMTLTHLVQRPGALDSMKQFCKPDGGAVGDPSNVVLFGLNMELQGNRRDQLGYLFDEGYRVFSSAAVARDAKGRAEQALHWLGERVDHILVHFDVDSIDGGHFPLANVPNFTGVGLAQSMEAMKVFVASEKVRGLIVAEANPDHDPELLMTGMMVDGLVQAFRERLLKAL